MYVFVHERMYLGKRNADFASPPPVVLQIFLMHDYSFLLKSRQNKITIYKTYVNTYCIQFVQIIDYVNSKNYTRIKFFFLLLCVLFWIQLGVHHRWSTLKVVYHQHRYCVASTLQGWWWSDVVGDVCNEWEEMKSLVLKRFYGFDDSKHWLPHQI